MADAKSNKPDLPQPTPPDPESIPIFLGGRLNMDDQAIRAYAEQVGEKIRKRELKRAPLGMVSKLDFPQRPGFRRHFFIEEPGNIQQAIEQGWQPVYESDIYGGADGRSGEPTRMGALVRVKMSDLKMGLLMEIPQEWLDEEFRREQEALDRSELALYRNSIEALNQGGMGGGYAPSPDYVSQYLAAYAGSDGMKHQ
jgi:hypothetical protein